MEPPPGRSAQAEEAQEAQEAFGRKRVHFRVAILLVLALIVICYAFFAKKNRAAIAATGVALGVAALGVKYFADHSKGFAWFEGSYMV